MNSDKVIYSHYKLGDGYATVAATYDEVTCTTKYSVAYCSPKDRFCRRVGRQVSAEKLEMGQARVIQNVKYDYKKMSYYHFCLNLLNFDLDCGNVPNWVRGLNWFAVSDVMAK